ncbi:hypothetical protein CUV01_18810 (plasmid) [Paracoccus tegillarcae]|uniref:Uncharacterized protein n=2 Tax=Paracoccus TaxID=265 RepID=A0A2K9F8V5_9RHOB|nr:hypothetical protein CUV01_18810 [Paracoccus tegillarcae]
MTMFHNFDGLTRNEGRWLNLWAAFDVTGDYLGTFTLDDLRAKAADAGKWVSAVRYRRAGQQIDQAALAQHFNGLPCGTTIFAFSGFRLSPVRDMGGSIEVCDPGEHDFWSVYGFHRDAEEWQIVHDAPWGEIGETLARIVDLTGELVEYRDLSHAYANTRLPDLVDLLAQRILDEIPDQDDADARMDDADAHPLEELRDLILFALNARRG